MAFPDLLGYFNKIIEHVGIVLNNDESRTELIEDLGNAKAIFENLKSPLIEDPAFKRQAKQFQKNLTDIETVLIEIAPQGVLGISDNITKAKDISKKLEDCHSSLKKNLQYLMDAQAVAKSNLDTQQDNQNKLWQNKTTNQIGKIAAQQHANVFPKKINPLTPERALKVLSDHYLAQRIKPLCIDSQGFDKFYCPLKIVHKVNEPTVNQDPIFLEKQIKIEELFLPANQLMAQGEANNEHTPDKKPNFLVVSGQPGVGKTTFVQYISYQWAGGVPSKSKLWESEFEWLFVLPLRDWHSSKFKKEFADETGVSRPWSLSAWVYEVYFSNRTDSGCDFNEFNDFWENEIEPKSREGKVLFVIDGYDEKPNLSNENFKEQDDKTQSEISSEQLDEVLKELLSSSACKIVTSREYALTGILSTHGALSHRRLTLTGFGPSERSYYVNNFFKKKGWIAEIVLNNIEKNPYLWDSAKVPLLLNAICGVVVNAETPGMAFSKMQTMGQLYQEVEIALLKWAYCHTGDPDLDKKHADNLQKPLEGSEEDHLKKIYEKERKYMTAIARKSAHTTSGPNLNNNLIITWTDLKIALISCGVEEAEVGKSCDALLKLEFIKAITNDGERGESYAYEFSHKTFHEYFWAKPLIEILEKSNGTDKIEVLKNLKRNLAPIKADPNYRLAILFSAGTAKNEQEFDLFMQALDDEAGKDMLGYHHMTLLIECTQQNWELAKKTTWVKKLRTELQNTIGHWWEHKDSLNIILVSDYSGILKNYTYLDHEYNNDLSKNIPLSQIQTDKEIKDFLEFAQRLDFLTSKMMDKIIEILKNSNPRIRRLAQHTLIMLGSKLNEAQKISLTWDLVRLAEDEKNDEGVRRSAMCAMEFLGENGKGGNLIFHCINKLLEMIQKDSNRFLRSDIIFILFQLNEAMNKEQQKIIIENARTWFNEIDSSARLSLCIILKNSIQEMNSKEKSLWLKKMLKLFEANQIDQSLYGVDASANEFLFLLSVEINEVGSIVDKLISLCTQEGRGEDNYRKTLEAQVNKSAVECLLYFIEMANIEQREIIINKILKEFEKDNSVMNYALLSVLTLAQNAIRENCGAPQKAAINKALVALIKNDEVDQYLKNNKKIRADQQSLAGIAKQGMINSFQYIAAHTTIAGPTTTDSLTSSNKMDEVQSGEGEDLVTFMPENDSAWISLSASVLLQNLNSSEVNEWTDSQVSDLVPLLGHKHEGIRWTALTILDSVLNKTTKSQNEIIANALLLRLSDRFYHIRENAVYKLMMLFKKVSPALQSRVLNAFMTHDSRKKKAHAGKNEKSEEILKGMLNSPRTSRMGAKNHSVLLSDISKNVNKSLGELLNLIIMNEHDIYNLCTRIDRIFCEYFSSQQVTKLDNISLDALTAVALSACVDTRNILRLDWHAIERSYEWSIWMNGFAFKVFIDPSQAQWLRHIIPEIKNALDNGTLKAALNEIRANEAKKLPSLERDPLLPEYMSSFAAAHGAGVGFGWLRQPGSNNSNNQNTAFAMESHGGKQEKEAKITPTDGNKILNGGQNNQNDASQANPLDDSLRNKKDSSGKTSRKCIIL